MSENLFRQFVQFRSAALKLDQSGLDGARGARKLVPWNCFREFSQLQSQLMKKNRCMCIHVTFKLQRQGKEMNLRALFSVFIEKKATQVEFEPTTFCFYT